ncbi:HpcH/HpaI aldolase/citrate lyase family protein [Nocardia stercoris]|uniref:CoA ester lyase n=1 Tax=Nocardia stercoris TaxID=2483361 RepID=A0A3M2KUX8_9NOCA|nr:CoA ester lyase [Nocardia stercoris]RMI28794.1 CoA ester lyase [Nocardia stercoris]
MTTALDPAARVRGAATLLFVPGDRPERFGKAAAAGADLVILDLEDAVPPDHKDTARAHVAEWVTAGNSCAVRINAVGTPWHDYDLIAMAALGCPVMLPKAEKPATIARTAGLLGRNSALIALIETANGVLRAEAIAGVPGVHRLALGTFDLAAELGVDPADREAMAAARHALVLAAAAGGLPGPVDGVTAGIDDPEQVADDARYGRRLGMTGKLCIHPRQLQPAARALYPTAVEQDWAARILAADTTAGVAVVDGTMVDKPVLERARRISALAERIPTDNR